MSNQIIVHDTFTHIGGAERVFLSLVALFPDSDICIGIIKPAFKQVLEKKLQKRIITSHFSLLPTSERYLSFFKPLLLVYWKLLNLSKYSLVISSSHSFSSKSVRASTKALHVAYIHTPPRYLYTEFNQMGWIKTPPWSWMLSPLVWVLRNVDYNDAQKPQILIANSKTVAARIAKYYDRSAQVIYPPVAIKPPLVNRKPIYYIFMSRIEQQKGIDAVIEVFTKLKLKLLVIGTGTQLKKYMLNFSNSKHIKFVGFVERRSLTLLLKHAKALIYASIHEDFGIVPVEFLGYGIPVIALRSGGVRETITNSKTGILISRFTTKDVSNAIEKVESLTFDPHKLHKYAQKFSVTAFNKKFLRIVTKNRKTQ